jgi:hypothetical protein
VLGRLGERRRLDDGAAGEVVVEDGLAVGLEDALGCRNRVRMDDDYEGEREANELTGHCGEEEVSLWSWTNMISLRWRVLYMECRVWETRT